MTEREALLNKEMLLEKFPGKGGWTYLALPGIDRKLFDPASGPTVHGRMDHYELNQQKLMPMGNGLLFLPVRAEIRKQIGKQAGDWVHLLLYAELLPSVAANDFLLCLADAPDAAAAFAQASNDQQQACLAWIDAATNDNAKVQRMVEAIRRLEAGGRF